MRRVREKTRSLISLEELRGGGILLFSPFAGNRARKIRKRRVFSRMPQCRQVSLAVPRREREHDAVPARYRVFALLLAAVLFPAPSGGQRDKPESPAAGKSTVRPQDRVDLNHATLEQLLKVPGMKRTWAERIIRFRPYRSKLDLVQEGVLPGDVYNRIRDYVIAHRDKH